MTCENPPVPDPEPELPPITHEGKNTFGCLVNGKVWVAEVDGGFGMIHKIQTDRQTNYFILMEQGLAQLFINQFLSQFLTIILK